MKTVTHASATNDRVWCGTKRTLNEGLTSTWNDTTCRKCLEAGAKGSQAARRRLDLLFLEQDVDAVVESIMRREA